jgi:hypothetical protein
MNVKFKMRESLISEYSSLDMYVGFIMLGKIKYVQSLGVSSPLCMQSQVSKLYK